MLVSVSDSCRIVFLAPGTMARVSVLTTLLAVVSTVQAQCGAGAEVSVTGSGSSYQASKGATSLYSGSSYLAAINAALAGAGKGERVAVMASGSIGASSISVGSGKIFEGCGLITAASRSGHGAIESLNTDGAEIRYLNLTGPTYFGMLFYGTKDLKLGKINITGGGLGIRFNRDNAANKNVTIDEVNVSGASSHAVETWNIDGLKINKVIARNVGECGLLLQKTTNAKVGLVDADNAGKGTGYAAFRMANQNGKLSNGQYTTNVFVDKVVARDGGRGVFCVSESGGAEITSVDIQNTGNNAVLIENCYNINIKGGTVKGGGEVRISARTEFANTRDVSITLTVNDSTVKESPCGTNTVWNISGNAKKTICTK